MDTKDRTVRATIFELLVHGATEVTSSEVADSSGLIQEDVRRSLIRLADQHRIVLADDNDHVLMAHPFSTLRTGYLARIGERSWLANCAWDAFAILALLGDGSIVAERQRSPDTVWNVTDGLVEPDGFIHFVVPASEFWDDIGFT